MSFFEWISLRFSVFGLLNIHRQKQQDDKPEHAQESRYDNVYDDTEPPIVGDGEAVISASSLLDDYNSSAQATNDSYEHNSNDDNNYYDELDPSNN